MLMLTRKKVLLWSSGIISFLPSPMSNAKECFKSSAKCSLMLVILSAEKRKENKYNSCHLIAIPANSQILSLGVGCKLGDMNCPPISALPLSLLRYKFQVAFLLNAVDHQGKLLGSLSREREEAKGTEGAWLVVNQFRAWPYTVNRVDDLTGV